MDGSVEGSITFPDHRVTVGRSSRILADIRAHDVVVMEGNIYCSDLLDIRSESSITGHVIAQRIRIDDGASLIGSVEVHSAKRQAEATEAFHAAETPAGKPADGSAPKPEEWPDPADVFKTTLREAAAAVSMAGGQPVRRVPGSRTLVEPTR